MQNLVKPSEVVFLLYYYHSTSDSEMKTKKDICIHLHTFRPRKLQQTDTISITHIEPAVSDCLEVILQTYKYSKKARQLNSHNYI